MNNHRPHLRWHRAESLDKSFIDALVAVARNAGHITFRGRTPDGAYFVRVLCPASRFSQLQGTTRDGLAVVRSDALNPREVAYAG